MEKIPGRELPVEAPADKKIQNLEIGNNAARGMLWTVTNVGLAKIVSLGSQFVLGWLLSRGDFGVYAIAISFSALALTLRNGGTEQILVQRGNEYEKLIPAVFRLALLFNFIAALILVFLAPFISDLYDAPDLKYLCWIIAVSIPMAAPVAIHRSKLAIDLRFTLLSKLDLISSLVRNVSMVLFALVGFGVYSFVLPLLLVGFFEWYAFSRYSGGALKWRLEGDISSSEIFSDSKWVLLGAVAIALSMQGDYLVIGLMETKEIVGSYFFGYQLLASLAIMFTQGVQMVMLPSLVHFVNDVNRMQQAYLKLLRIMVFLLVPVGVIAAILAEPLLRLLWGDKWVSAVIVIQLLAFSLPSWVLILVSRSILEAKAMWRLRMGVLFVDAMGVMLAAFVGAQLGGLFMIALMIMAYRLVFTILISFLTAKILTLSIVSVVNAILWPIIITLFSGVAGWITANFITSMNSVYQYSGVLLVTFITVFLGLTALLRRGQLREISDVISNIRQ